MPLTIANADPGIFAALEQTWLIIKVIFGIGLMIFIHELGHFFAAKWAKVRVETFSLGFGPRLFGWRRGDTLYQLCIVPLGGYVKMAGENPGEDLTGADDELPSKPPFQRMVIFAAGVLMNLIFAFITFPIIFATGVPFIAPEVGAVEPGGPAWKAELLPGDKILEIHGNTIYEFHDIALNVALSKSPELVVLLEREGRTMELTVKPEKNDEVGFSQIAIAGPGHYEAVIAAGGPAERAGLCTGDKIVSIDGIETTDWLEARSGQEYEEVRIEVVRLENEQEQNLNFTVVPEKKELEEKRLIGIQPRFNTVRGIRGALAEVKNGLREGDRVQMMGARDIFTQEDWTEALEKEPLTFEVVYRSGSGAEIESESKAAPSEVWQTRTVNYAPRWREALKADLALTRTRGSNTVTISPNRALWDMGYRTGVTVHEMNGKKIACYDDILELIDESKVNEFKLVLTPWKGEQSETVTVTALPMEIEDLGLDYLVKPRLLTRKLNVFEACRAGFNCAIYQVKNCYLTLSRIISRDVSAKNLGGIITISRATYSFAQLGLARLFFFLAILSINLGFINILPIPVLDGGHLMFLLIEKIKGSPVNEKVMGYSQVIGLVLILALLAYVTYNDILRLFN